MQWWESVVGIRGTTSSHEKEWWCRGWLSIGDYELNTKEYKRKQDHFRKKVHKQRQRWENARHCTGKEDSDVVNGASGKRRGWKSKQEDQINEGLVYQVKQLWFNQISTSASWPVLSVCMPTTKGCRCQNINSTYFPRRSILFIFEEER